MSTPTREAHSNISSAVMIAPSTPSADTTPISIDLLGFRAAAIMLYIGVGGITFSGTNKIDFVLEHSADNTTWSPVAATDMTGVTVAAGGIVRSLVAAKAAADIQEMSYIGGRRYIRLTADFSGTHGSGTPMTAFAIRALPEMAPAA
jgi:hypothetical protein